MCKINFCLLQLDGDQPDADDDEPDFYAEAPLPG